MVDLGLSMGWGTRVRSTCTLWEVKINNKNKKGTQNRCEKGQKLIEKLRGETVKSKTKKKTNILMLKVGGHMSPLPPCLWYTYEWCQVLMSSFCYFFSEKEHVIGCHNAELLHQYSWGLRSLFKSSHPGGIHYLWQLSGWTKFRGLRR